MGHGFLGGDDFLWILFWKANLKSWLACKQNSNALVLTKLSPISQIKLVSYLS